jgi:hypothetical protein
VKTRIYPEAKKEEIMKANVGSPDRINRLVLAVGFFYLAFFALSGTWAIVTGVLGVVMLGTAAISYCPLYAPLGIGTYPVRTDFV